MKIIVIGANGHAGKLIVDEALKKGLDVTGLGRGENTSKALKYLKKDALELNINDLTNYDVIVDAVGGWTESTIPNITKVMKHLADILGKTNKKLIVVGGAGSLYTNKERTITVDMGPDFPEAWKPLSNAHGEGLNYLRQKQDLNWTYISPACNFDVDGAETGEYQIGGEDLILSAKGESVVSYKDYAMALVNVIISGKYNQKRISVCAK